MGNAEYSFIDIAPRSGLAQSEAHSRVLSSGRIDI